MEYNVLLERYEKLLEENKILKNENKTLKKKLNLDCSIYNDQNKEMPPTDTSKNTEVDKTAVNAVDNYSSPKEKKLVNVVTLTGRMSSKQRKSKLEKLNMMKIIL